MSPVFEVQRLIADGLQITAPDGGKLRVTVEVIVDQPREPVRRAVATPAFPTERKEGKPAALHRIGTNADTTAKRDAAVLRVLADRGALDVLAINDALSVPRKDAHLRQAMGGHIKRMAERGLVRSLPADKGKAKRRYEVVKT